MLALEPGSVEHVAHPESPPHSRLGITLMTLSRAFAFAGGILFIALIAVSLVSVVGRKLASLPVPGDMEMMQMAGAVAAAAFFPYCQMTDGHVRVDFFTAWLPDRGKALLDGVAALLLAGVMTLVAWRTVAGAVSARESGEVSLMLGWPVWFAIIGIVPSLMLFVCTSLYIARRRFRRFGLHQGVAA